MPTQPSLRIGDRERDAVAAELREHFAHGRLSLDEFNQRLDATFAAKTQGDLTRITADLPHIRSGGGPLPSSRTGSARQLASGPPLGWSGGSGAGSAAAAGAYGSSTGGPATAAGTWPSPSGQPWPGRGLAAPGTAWSGSSWSGSSWSGSQHRHDARSGFAVLATLLAALGSWLIVYHVVLVGLQFPWPGRLGLLVAIFTIIRGLLRRIFGLRRRRGHLR